MVSPGLHKTELEGNPDFRRGTSYDLEGLGGGAGQNFIRIFSTYLFKKADLFEVCLCQLFHIFRQFRGKNEFFIQYRMIKFKFYAMERLPFYKFRTASI